MLHTFRLGQMVPVWPRPGLHVQEHPQIPGRFLPSAGTVVAWSSWWHRRVLDGSVCLSDPRVRAASPVEAVTPAPQPQGLEGSEA